MEYEVSFRRIRESRQTERAPFEILVLGNFSGHAPDKAPPAFVSLDLDNLEELWSRFEPQLGLPLGGESLSFAPGDIDDFHPDQLYRSLPLFRELRKTRKRLLDPATGRDTLADLLSRRGAIEGELVEPAGPESESESEDGEAMFERLLGKRGDRRPEPRSAAPGQAELDSFISRVIEPHIVHEPDPRLETAVGSIDLATSELMREVLHHPDFQALEASWRSLYDLVSQLEFDENLRLTVADVSRAQLLAALPDPGITLEDSGLFRMLVEPRRQAADDSPWTLILGDFYFGSEPEDIALLTGLGAAAAAQGAVFIGGATPRLLGCKSVAELADARYWSAAKEGESLWQTLRANPIAAHIGLALPRVLARLPYGEATEPTEAFEFEEMPQRTHEQYLWANPAYSCGRLLAESFRNEGWGMVPGDHVGLGDLPAHHFREDGETKLQPCTELLISESTMVAMLEQGLMPLVSYRNQSTAVLGRFQSIARPPTALAGPWGR